LTSEEILLRKKSQESIFLKKKLILWFQKLQIAGQDRYKQNAVAEGAFPVALRLRDDAIERILEDLESDREGDRDCPDGESFFCAVTIPPHELDVWDGDEWRPIRRVRSDTMIKKARKRSILQTVQGYEYLDLDAQTFRPRVASHQRNANPSWWTEPLNVIPTLELLAAFDEMLAIQCSDGNWNFDPYMHGMANGMLLMKSLVDGKEPQYLDAPVQWLGDVPNDPKLTVQAGFCAACRHITDILTTPPLRYRGRQYRIANTTLPSALRHFRQAVLRGK